MLAREKREREREREGRQREKRRGRPTRAERGDKEARRHVHDAPDCAGTGSPVSCKQAPRRRRRGTQASHQKRKRRRRRRERKSKETPEPRKTTPAKNPAAFSAQNLAKALYPNNKAWPLKSTNK